MFFITPPLVPRSSPYFKGTAVKVVYYSCLKYLIAHNPPLLTPLVGEMEGGWSTADRRGGVMH